MRFEVLTPGAEARAELFGRSSEGREPATLRRRGGRIEPPLGAADVPPTAADLRDRAENAAADEAWLRRPLGVFVGAAAGVASGIVPGLAPMFAAHAGLSQGPWCGALRFGFAPAQTAQLSAPTGVGGSVALASAALEGGLLLKGFALEFPLLAGVEAGAFWARGLGVPERSTHWSDWLAAYVSPGISHTWRDRLRLFLRLDGLLGLRRPSFAVGVPAGSPLVFHRPDLLAGRIYLGLEVVLR